MRTVAEILIAKDKSGMEERVPARWHAQAFAVGHGLTVRKLGQGSSLSIAAFSASAVWTRRSSGLSWRLQGMKLL